MPKVLHLSSVHLPFDTRIFHRECQSLFQAGYEVVLVVPRDAPNDVIQGVKIISLPKPKNRLWRLLITGWMLFWKAYQEKADLYHFHDPELIGFCLLLKLLSGLPVIYDVHEHYPDAIRERNWIPGFLQQVLAKIFDWGEILFARGFDAIITADDEVAKRFKGNNNMQVSIFNYPREDLYRGIMSSHSNNDRVRVVYLGVISSSRGLWIMVETMKKLVKGYGDKIELILAGRIPDNKERKQFEGILAADPVLANRIEWLGRISQKQVVSLLAKSDIGWIPFTSIPKFQKNIPTKLFEYMASGLPTVASDLRPIRKYINKTKSGFLVSSDLASEHANAIYKLAKSTKLMKEMGEKGREAFFERYNWESEEEKLINLYNILLKKDYRKANLL